MKNGEKSRVDEWTLVIGPRTFCLRGNFSGESKKGFWKGLIRIHKCLQR